jgi:hypothetical protein
MRFGNIEIRNPLHEFCVFEDTGPHTSLLLALFVDVCLRYPNETDNQDAYLDGRGNPVPKGSNPAHLYPPESVWWLKP